MEREPETAPVVGAEQARSRELPTETIRQFGGMVAMVRRHEGAALEADESAPGARLRHLMWLAKHDLSC